LKSTGNCSGRATARALVLSGIWLAAPVPPAAAADYGVGATHNGEGDTVLVPIRMESLVVEPEVSYARFKSTITANGASGTSTSTSYGLATGVYARRALGASFEGYFGGRAGIEKFRSSADSGLRQRVDTWFVAPTAGLQHYFSKQFSIALDVGLVYERDKNKLASGAVEQTLTTRGVNTRTRILLRAYF